jgi:uncharacterized membrane protein
MGGQLVPQYDARVSVGLGSAIGLGLLVVGFLIYDVMWKSLAKQEMAGMAISFLLTVGVAFGLAQIFVGRAVLIHIGALYGTIMAANVWMRIWPNQRKIIAGIKNGTPVDAAIPALAGLRSKHNTYMSMPLLFLMISNHYPTVVYGTSNDTIYAPLAVAGFVAVGWLMTKRLFGISAGTAPSQFMPADAAPAPAATAEKK